MEFNNFNRINNFFKLQNEITELLDKSLFDYNNLNVKLDLLRTDDSYYCNFNLPIKENNIAAYVYPEKLNKNFNKNSVAHVELRMCKLLEEFVTTNVNPHILLILGSLIVKNINWHTLVPNSNTNQLKNQALVLLKEPIQYDFLKFIRNNYKEMILIDWKVFFFQILSVLACIQLKYPTFRHNNFKACDISVEKISKHNKYKKYALNGTNFYVPNIGYQTKIASFIFSQIPGLVDNDLTEEISPWTGIININRKPNRYYDIHYLFNSLIRKGFFPEILTSEFIPIEVKNFINRIVPDQYKYGKNVHKRGRLLIDDEYTTPYQILMHDDFFKEFRHPPRFVFNSESESVQPFIRPKLYNFDCSLLFTSNV